VTVTGTGVTIIAALWLGLHAPATASAQTATCPAPTIEQAQRLKADVDRLTEERKFEAALPISRCLVQVAEAIFGRDNATSRNLRDQLVELLRNTGRTDEAVALASASPKNAADTLQVAEFDQFTVRSKALMDRGDYQEAFNVCLEARHFLESRSLQRDIRYAVMLNECARALEYLEQFPLAERLYTDSIDLARSIGGPRHAQVAVGLNNLGLMYWKRKRYEEAVAALEQAMTLDSADDPERASVLVNLGLAYHAVGRSADARRVTLEARDIVLGAYGPTHPSLGSIYSNLASQNWAANRLDEAITWQAQANAVAEAHIESVVGLGDERQKLAFLSTLGPETHASVTLGAAVPASDARGVRLGLDVVLQRKGRVLDELSDSMDAMRRSLSAADRRFVDEWRTANKQYADLLFGGPGDDPRMYKSQVETVKGRIVALETQLGLKAATGRSRFEAATIDRVQREIPHDSLLVEWFRYRAFQPSSPDQARWSVPRYIAYVLGPEGPPIGVDVGEAAPIENSLFELLVALREKKDDTLVRELARELDDRLMARVRPLLTPGRRLLLSPDGPLNLLPFGVLVGSDGRFLIEAYEHSYLTSGRDLLRPRSVPSASRGTFVFADPDFGENPGPDTAAGRAERRSAAAAGLTFDRLQGTAREADALRTVLHLAGDQVLTGARATETALKTLHRPRIVHLATHGFFLPEQTETSEAENPLLRSGLALAGANQRRSGEDDGLLSALEVAGLDFADTELAVLSACETGVGKVQNGEGVYGLRRALTLAGVRTQVASLWRIDDAATSDLMVDFYERLKTGAGRGEALRGAQLKMLRNPARAHPMYWAAFVVIGDTAPLKP
jgi:CHAT domain-containing protein/tetratricopeptide (TPR) repeat protein